MLTPAATRQASVAAHICWKVADDHTRPWPADAHVHAPHLPGTARLTTAAARHRRAVPRGRPAAYGRCRRGPVRGRTGQLRPDPPRTGFGAHRRSHRRLGGRHDRRANIVGELGMLTGQGTFLACEAREPSQVIVVPQPTVRELVATVPEISDVLVTAFAARRRLLIEWGEGGLTIVGSEDDTDTVRLLEFARHSSVPYRFARPDRPCDGRAPRPGCRRAAVCRRSGGHRHRPHAHTTVPAGHRRRPRHGPADAR